MAEATNETKPTVLVYPGLEFSETEKSAGRYIKMLPHRRFNIVVKSARWKDPEETVEAKKERIRKEIIEVARETGRPPGVVAVSASGLLLTEATHGLAPDELGALVTVASPLDAGGMIFDTLPESMLVKLRKQSPVFLKFAEQLMHEGISQLTETELHRMLNVYGERDQSVPPQHSGLEGAENRQFWTPYLPGKLGILTHAYNIARGLKTPQLTKFLSEKLQDIKS